MVCEPKLLHKVCPIQIHMFSLKPPQALHPPHCKKVTSLCSISIIHAAYHNRLQLTSIHELPPHFLSHTISWKHTPTQTCTCKLEPSLNDKYVSVTLAVCLVTESCSSLLSSEHCASFNQPEGSLFRGSQVPPDQAAQVTHRRPPCKIHCGDPEGDTGNIWAAVGIEVAGDEHNFDHWPTNGREQGQGQPCATNSDICQASSSLIWGPGLIVCHFMSMSRCQIYVHYLLIVSSPCTHIKFYMPWSDVLQIEQLSLL